MTSILIPIVLGLSVTALPTSPPVSGWEAGVAKSVITPNRPMWMAGYGSRSKPSEGKIHDLWAKSLALKDPRGQVAVLVTLDLCGIGPDVSDAVRDAARAQHGIERDRIVLACSHTHSGPVVGTNLISMYKLDDEQRTLINEYTKALIQTIGKIITDSIDDLEPGDASWGTGKADFAVNRRANKEADVPAVRAALALEGPVDHDVPVLKLSDKDGRLKAVVAGYACHCTVLSDYVFCGDYAGFAQAELEKSHPGAQAMFVAGCGADQNPLPRRTVELAEEYGRALAGAVDDVLAGSLHKIQGPMGSIYEEIPLKFAKLPTQAEVEEQVKSKDFYVSSRGKTLLAKIAKDGKLSETYPYPVQIWGLGDLNWVFLGGEVVVDYSLRLKRNLGSSTTWVSGYCNDVMAYIPSLRVLKEGGYEGGGSMLYYGQPSPWDETVEVSIIESVNRQMKKLRGGE